MMQNTIKVIKISKASKVRTITITLVLFLVVSSMGTSFASFGDVAENKFTINCKCISFIRLFLT